MTARALFPTIWVTLLIGPLWSLASGCALDRSGLMGLPDGGVPPGEDAGAPRDAAMDASPVDGGPVDGGPVDSGPVDGGCVLGATRCAGSTLYTCDATGAEAEEDCLLGCLTAPSPHCGVLIPSNVEDRVPLEIAGTRGFATADGRPYIFNTDTGEISLYNGAITPADPVRGAHVDSVDPDVGIYYTRLSALPAVGGGPPPPDLGVWVMRSLTVSVGHAIGFIGRRAAILLVEADVSVVGQIASYAAAGLGGTRNASGSGPAPGEGGIAGGGESYYDSGGGGGGFGSGGGRGGREEPTYPAGGGTYGGPTLVPLYGGSGGGGGSCDDDGPRGGIAGGALQISAGGQLVVSGLIDVGGGGGGGGTISSQTCGGGGGGSGGGLLLEARGVDVTGLVVAAGGGGGGGGHTSAGGPGRVWRDGGASLQAPGGAAGSGETGSGGRGSPSAGTRGEDGADAFNGGGGGGGSGWIRINSLGLSFVETSGTFTPSFAGGAAALATEGDLVVR